MIKKFYVSAVFLAVFCISATALFAQGDGSSEESTTSFQILGSMSLGYASNSDMNSSAKDSGQDDADYYNSLVSGDPFGVENSTANFTYGFDLDLRYFFGNFGVGAEVGYHLAEAKSEVSASGWADKANTIISLTVVPVVATCFYMIPLNDSKNFILFGAGLGYYSGKLEIKWEDKDTIGGDNSFTLNGKQNKIGYHALVEYNYVMESGLTFFTGVKVRYVSFDKFEKSGNTINTYGGGPLSASLTGVNWYFGAGLSI